MSAKTPASPRSTLIATRERLTGWVWPMPPSDWTELISARPCKRVPRPHRFLDQLLDAELACREERRIKTSLQLSSGCPPGRPWRTSTSLSSRRSSARDRDARHLPVDPAEPHAADPGAAGRGQDPSGGGPGRQGHRARLRGRCSTGWKSCWWR